MDIIIILSLLFAFGSLICGFMLEGGSPAALIQISALIIVFGGTFGAVGVSCSSKVVKKFFKIMGIAFKKRNIDIKQKNKEADQSDLPPYIYLSVCQNFINLGN